MAYDVFLSAGHGGRDPGAIGHGLKEKDINLSVMLACARFLMQNSISVLCSRTCDEDDPVAQEVAEANASGARIAIDFHVNAGGGDGVEVYYCTGDPDGQRLAQMLLDAAKSLGQNSRGIKPTKSLYFITGTKMVANLVESAFIDSDDIYIIDEASEQEAFGIEYAKAIMDYLGRPYNPLPAPAPDGSFLIQAKEDLNVRTGPGVEYPVVGKISPKYRYTIVDTAKASDGGTWGLLKSGYGWINVSPKYVDRF